MQFTESICSGYSRRLESRACPAASAAGVVFWCNMAVASRQPNRTSSHFLFARLSALFLGVGMVVWSVTPALIERLVSAYTPSPSQIFSQLSVCVLGFAFIGLNVLIRRGVTWALWATCGITAVICAAGLALITVHGVRTISSCLLMLSGCACCASWLAIVARSRQAILESLKAERPRSKSRHRMFLES